MCGLFISNANISTKGLEKKLEHNLRFRGPDSSSGIIHNNGWISYHSRLSIIDLSSSANQPVLNKDGSQLVFNGEILNYKELGFKYFSVKYNSDTLLLNDLITHNKINISELDGFFSFIFIDGSGKLKYACRDRFGVKPLFYIESNDSITFSSEPNILKEIFLTPINKEAIEEYRLFRAPIFQGSFFEGVKQVEPGECLINGKYFSVRDELSSSKESDIALDELNEAIKKGVNSRCISDAKVGLLLSKGIDSNLIRFYNNFDSYYSIGFKGDEDVEYLQNQKIDNLKIKLINKDEFIDSFNFLLNLRKEPLSVPNEVLLFYISKVAKNDGVKVLLSGEGADEFFAGYDRIFSWANNISTFDTCKFLSLYAYDECKKDSNIYYKVDQIFKNCDLENPFEKVRWFFIKYHMPVLFRRLDFSLMAGGIEGREPIANMHLFDVCKRISGKSLMFNDLGKKPLREIIVKYMGKDFAYERKVGFPVDLTKIFNNPRNLNSYELWFEKNLEILR